MHFNAYGGNGAELAAALVNATEFTPEVLAVTLSEHGMLRTRLTHAQARELGEWRHRLAPVFGELDQDTQIRLINDLLQITASKPHVSAHDGREPHLHFFSIDADIVSRAKDTTAGGLAMAISFSDGRRLGRCDRTGCETVYVDTSRNGRRRFCSLTCANRVNVAAHRSRNAQSPSTA
ncbi:CGNR zinc finger domain-containing protein [Spongiactinospora sp. TRM90649]|uniref:CGNR zinc finger domain-containing protein n=1 Tax=Spongiactinospora sp. TRM90649 TaxID=3031114 RepID=UPI0023F71166|nr:CGNR zinc finger domain-containing protein [Spongiactinospora sp. TRM90649]MDF5753297.1 CGNR zinc finger domain-containing protein [Spongiactinospora sp. TRM90649]